MDGQLPEPDAEPGRQTPEVLRTLEEFVNSTDIEEGTDAVGTPAAMAAWLVDHGLIDGATEVGPPELERLLRLREALRAVLLAHAGEADDDEANALLDAEGASAPLRVRLDAGGVTLGPACRGVDGAVATLLASIVRAAGDGNWTRLKACRKHSCRWAYYDFSRNGSRNWCTMRTCGNRTKARRYRERQRIAGEGKAVIAER